MSDAARETQRDLIRGLSHLPLRMPRSPRELLHLLALHDPAQDIMATLARVDTRGVTPIDVYRLVHGRAPDGVKEALGGVDYDARAHMRAALLSPEFQGNSVKMLLSALADKPREVFIHVPKCAGTDLILNVAPQRLGVPHLLGLAGWISPPDLLGALSHLARAAPLHDDVFVYGHIEFGQYVDTNGVRPGDRFFTIIRDPFDLLLSQANYAVSRLCQDPLGHDPDTRETLDFLGLPHLPDTAPATLKELAVRCLLDPRISQPNRICYFLGSEQPTESGEPRSPYAKAIRNIVVYDFEITTAFHYTRWLKERWNVVTSIQHNTSIAFLARREARRLFADRLAPSIAEDQKLYDVVTWALESSGRSSIGGREIARIGGRELLQSVPTRLGAVRRQVADPLLVAQEPEFVELYLAPLPEALIAPERRLQSVLDVRFGAGSDGREHTREGWWKPEEHFTWTSGTQAHLVIDRPKIAGDHVLRLIATPLIADERVRSQRLAMSVNGVPCGEAIARDVAVFDCDLAWTLLEREAQIRIVLDIPDAAEAGGEDRRIVGFAVRQLLLLRIGEGIAPVPEPLPLADLATRFESLGENCEFGLVQRRCGAEPLGLLRFSSTPLQPLLRALRARFSGMGRPEFIDIEIADSGREYMVFDKRFHFRYHAWVNVGEQEPEDIHARETRRLPFLIRKLIDDLTDGQKIFVYRGMAPLIEREVRALHAAIRTYGPGMLLWVELADAEHAPGSVVEIAPGLLKGHVDRFAPGENAQDVSLDCWIALCRAAARMAGRDAAG